jgi:hypothetical protein
MYKKWLNIFKILHLNTIFMAKTFQTNKKTCLCPEIFCRKSTYFFFKASYTFGAHCIQPILENFKVEKLYFFKISHYVHTLLKINITAFLSETIQDSLKFSTDLNFLMIWAANGTRQRTFVFLGRQTINGNRWLLFQQTCPSMVIDYRQLSDLQTCPSVSLCTLTHYWQMDTIVPSSFEIILSSIGSYLFTVKNN